MIRAVVAVTASIRRRMKRLISTPPPTASRTATAMVQADAGQQQVAEVVEIVDVARYHEPSPVTKLGRTAEEGLLLTLVAAGYGRLEAEPARLHVRPDDVVAGDQPPLRIETGVHERTGAASCDEAGNGGSEAVRPSASNSCKKDVLLDPHAVAEPGRAEASDMLI